MIDIDQSVGKGGKNRPIDVIEIQNLIDNNDLYTRLPTPLPLTGINDARLEKAIESFQKNHPGLNVIDGRVDPHGKTLQALNQYNNTSRVCRSYFPSWWDQTSLHSNFDVARFLSLYARQFPHPTLSGKRQDGLKFLIEKMIADPDLDNLLWAAYMLATVKHECANTWQPIEEYGKGSGRSYGKAVKVIDPVSKKTFSNIYYGRGYVQLTWEANYKKMDKALHLSGKDSLHLHPDNALKPEVAYQIMSYGMRHGSFTGKKLADYIKVSSADYFNARRIINATDKANTIKGYAQAIEFLLRFCNGK